MDSHAEYLLRREWNKERETSPCCKANASAQSFVAAVQPRSRPRLTEHHAQFARNEAQIVRELVALVRERIGPVASFRDARIVLRLPKTRSGKILRASIRRIADGQPANAPATIDDPAILDEIGIVLGR